MALSDFVTVTITSATRTPSQQGFGTPLVLGYFTAWADRVRTYSSSGGLTAMAADGIGPTGVGAATYWAAAAIFAQNPSVEKIKVGRRTNAWTQRVDLIVTSATQSLIYKGTIGAIGTSAVSFQRTVPGASTIAAEAAAIKALIDALGLAITTSLQTTSVANDTVRCTANVPGQMFVFAGRNPELQIFDNTLAPAAITTDLDAISAVDDDWFGLHLDSSSKAECLLVAPYVETKIKHFFASTSDTENGTVGASNTLLKQFKAATYVNSSVWVDQAVLPSFLGAGIMGEEFPFDPLTQTGTYKGKTVAGVTVDALSTTFEGEVITQNGNVYTTVLGINVTREGKTPSGEFIDVVIGRHALTARLKENAFGNMTSGRRIPYTNSGVAILRGGMLGVLKRAQGTAVKPGFLDPETDPVVTAPRVEDVDPLLRAARTFPDLSFSARIAGAIHLAKFVGVLTV
jgi:Protein of unknown function (DUF3383)